MWAIKRFSMASEVLTRRVHVFLESGDWPQKDGIRLALRGVTSPLHPDFAVTLLQDPERTLHGTEKLWGIELSMFSSQG